MLSHSAKADGLQLLSTALAWAQEANTLDFEFPHPTEAHLLEHCLFLVLFFFFFFKYLFSLSIWLCQVLAVACRIFRCVMWNLVPLPEIEPRTCIGSVES